LKLAITGIIIIIFIGSFGIQNVFGHNPDSEINTSEDVLKFCEFFYEEYEILGINSLIEQHPNFPNLRACVILYNHIAWNSTHQARDVVLIAEIEKFLGDSSYIKERHIDFSNFIPDWVKREAQLWVNDENQDRGFVYGIRTLLEAEVLTLNFSEKSCNENNLCFKEGDFIRYTHFDKYGNAITIKHIVESINDDEIKLNVEKISQDGIIKEDIVLDKKGLIKTKECCQYYEFVIPTPISIGDNVFEDVKIVAETTYIFDNQIKQSWLASDPTGQNTKIIDKKTGLVFLHEFHETEVLTVGDETKITDTNFFDAKYDMEAHDIVIPNWWKKTTTWLLEEMISESEYLRAMENLIERNIIRV